MKGHEITTEHPWLNGLEVCKWAMDRGNSNCTGGPTGTGTFHPGKDGQEAFKRNYADQLVDGPGRVLYDP